MEEQNTNEMVKKRGFMKKSRQIRLIEAKSEVGAGTRGASLGHGVILNGFPAIRRKGSGQIILEPSVGRGRVCGFAPAAQSAFAD